jgi:uncharacterized protein
VAGLRQVAAIPGVAHAASSRQLRKPGHLRPADLRQLAAHTRNDQCQLRSIPHRLARPAKEVRYRSGMKLTDESNRGVHLVRAYAPGELRIGERSFQRSCLLRADRIEDWRPQSLSQLGLPDLAPIFALEPEIIVLGSGSTQRFPDSALMAAVWTRGIGLEVMDTGAACRTYNILVTEDRRVVAALLLQDD